MQYLSSKIYIYSTAIQAEMNLALTLGPLFGQGFINKYAEKFILVYVGGKHFCNSCCQTQLISLLGNIKTILSAPSKQYPVFLGKHHSIWIFSSLVYVTCSLITRSCLLEFIKKIVSVLLSASVERFSVSRMRDFLYLHCINPLVPLNSDVNMA